jgi:hypothetical protein
MAFDALLFSEAQMIDLINVSNTKPNTKIYGEITFRSINIGMGFKTAAEYIAFMNDYSTKADKASLSQLKKCHHRLMFMSSVMEPTKLSSPFFVPTSQRKEIRKVAHIIGPSTNEISVEKDGRMSTASFQFFEVTEELISSIIDEFISSAMMVIRRKLVPLDLSHNVKFGVVAENMSEKTFLASLKVSLSLCFAQDCNHVGTKTCAVCHQAKYCSVLCQKKDWKVKHRKLCKHKQGDLIIVETL